MAVWLPFGTKSGQIREAFDSHREKLAGADGSNLRMAESKSTARNAPTTS
jgi:hypothetical protein